MDESGVMGNFATAPKLINKIDLLQISLGFILFTKITNEGGEK